ncbi:MAG: dihydrodipicolinate synthase family protein [Deltaproteobacteria bacterium]|nr:MAG: dihydrodipicolinate synthase family protein [Deltaproteobacteria bacterium]
MPTSISGIFPALTTPFEKGDLSVSQLKSNIEKFERMKLSGYLVLGSTGESVLMNDRERIKAVETVRASASEGKTIIAGTGMQSTRATIEFTNLAAGAGADYGLVVTPFYFKRQMTAENLENYYREVAEKSVIPVLMYNVPKFTGLDLPLNAILSLADHPNIAGLKESSGNMALMGELIKHCPEDFVIFQGTGSLLFTSLMLGARGGILALSNMAPAETVEIFEMVNAGQLEKAREIQMRLITLNERVVNSYGVPGIKCAMDLLGYFGGHPRPPLQPVPQEIKDSIGQLLKDASLL